MVVVVVVVVGVRGDVGFLVALTAQARRFPVPLMLADPPGATEAMSTNAACVFVASDRSDEDDCPAGSERVEDTPWRYPVSWTSACWVCWERVVSALGAVRIVTAPFTVLTADWAAVVAICA